MNLIKIVIILIWVMIFNMISFTSVANNQVQQSTPNILNEAELEQLLAPIALYPDSLLTHILIASTYPLEIVQGQRWLDKHPNIDTAAIADGVENKDWDASVKALLPFPRVIKRLNDDLVWTQKLGDAFLQNEKQVLASIQKLRQKADLAGSLDQMDNMDVSRNNNTIIIQPVQPDVVYVPYYDSRAVYGDWYWQDHPPVYWRISNRHHYLPSSINSRFYWNSGITISFNYFFNAFHWRQHRIVEVEHYAPRFRNSYSYSYGYKLNRHHTRPWRHEPSHRRGVAYHNKQLAKRYYHRFNRSSDAYLQGKVHQQNDQKAKITRRNHVNRVYKKRVFQEPRMKNFQGRKVHNQYEKFNKQLAATRQSRVHVLKKQPWRKRVVANTQTRAVVKQHYVVPQKTVRNNNYSKHKSYNYHHDINKNNGNLKRNYSKNKNNRARYRR